MPEVKPKDSTLGALFYPAKDSKGNVIPFDSLYIPWIYKEIYFDGIYTDILNQKKDMTIIDVGANIGVVTQHMRNYAKKVYSLEPSPEHFNALKSNKEFNNWDNVEVFNVALADTDGAMTMHSFSSNRTCNSLTNDYGQDSYMVNTTRFDTFMKDNNVDEVDFVKFDVEGAEDMILRSEGFKNIATKIKAIEVEFHYSNWQDLVKYMIELGFAARRYDCSAIVVLFTR